MRRIKNLTIIFALILSGIQSAQAEDFELQIKEDLLNDLIEVMDVKSFDGEINLGIAQQPYEVTVDSLEVSVRSSGISYEATLKVLIMGLTFFLDVEGDAEAWISGNKISFALASLNFPVKVPLPIHGEVTLFTIHTPLTQRLDWTFNQMLNLRVGRDLVVGKLEDASIDTGYQILKVKGNVAF